MARIGLLAVGASLFGLASASATTTFVWQGTGSDSNWSTSGNWTTTAPTSNASNILSFTGSTGLTPFADGTSWNLWGINFASASGSFTLSGATLDLSASAASAIALDASGAAAGTTQIVGNNIVLSNTNAANGIRFTLPTASTATLTINGSVTSTLTGNTLQLAGSAGSGIINGHITLDSTATLLKRDLGTWTINSTGNTFGNVSISSGILTVGVADALDTSTVITASGGTINLSGHNQTVAGINSTSGGSVTSASAATFTVSGATNSSYAGTITGTGLSLAKGGAGLLRLSGVNTFAGGTSITGGSLYANNLTGSATGTGAVNVSSGATLGGTGIVAPTGSNGITVAGTLTPGDGGAGTLSLFTSSSTGKLTFSSGSTLAFDLGTSSDLLTFATAGDWLRGAGNAALNLTLGSGFNYGSSYTLFSNVTTTGFTFSSITGYDTTDYAAVLSKSGNSYLISFDSVPEPSTCMMMLGAGAMLLIGFRRDKTTA